MIRAYSQRILPPFSGIVLIAESQRARAQSFDGINWEIQYIPGGKSSDRVHRVQGYGLNRGYYNVAILQKQELKTFIFPKCLDHADVEESIAELSAFLSTATVPFPAADIFEFWLLDGVDRTPLALIHSCCDESLMNSYPGQAEWTALPHSKMKIDNTQGEQARNEPPVNHRFQRLIARRAGSSPKAAWFRRDLDHGVDFPSLMVREDWQHEGDSDLCQRYLMRKAPRLLMLQGLAQENRERLEIAAKQHVFEVDEYFNLYPEINDMQRLSAIRIEARLRRTAQATAVTRRKETAPKDTKLDKDMRIFET